MKKKKVQTVDEMPLSIRQLSQDKLGSFVQLIECPFGWDDLKIPGFLKDILKEFESAAKERKQFWQFEKEMKHLKKSRRGLSGLFVGQPGTGKTMAAQVIASELGLDLFRIDLSSLVNKYIRETSQNLERILSRAEHMDVVLLFDEADALFGKRTEVNDAHDRYATADINFLLQTIEEYRGIAILAVNNKENIDIAFLRRVRYVIEFPKQDYKPPKKRE